MEHFNTAEGLADNSVTVIFESSDGSLWFGTYSGGVSRYWEGTWTRSQNPMGWPIIGLMRSASQVMGRCGSVHGEESAVITRKPGQPLPPLMGWPIIMSVPS